MLAALQLASSFDNPEYTAWSEESMSIYSFQDYNAYLLWVRSNYPGAKRALSLDRWAKKLGYRSPRSIAMVLKGQRLPTEEMILAISNDLKLNTEERRYFELLVLKEKYKKKDSRLKAVLEEIQGLNPKYIERKTLSAEMFAYVAEWYHLAIKQLVRSKSFQDKPEWIAKQLRGKITPGEAQKALETMLKLGVLTKNVEGKTVYNEDEDLITPADIPSTAVRKHFRQQMERAAEALEEQALHEREFTSLTFRMPKKRLEAAKKFIREFRDKFAGEFEESDGSDVCQLNVQLFYHTKDNNNV